MQRLRIYVLSTLVVFSALWLLYNLPLGADWHMTFYPLITNYLGGQTRLYDAASPGYFNPPWILPLLLPFGFVNEETGLLILRVAGLGVLCTCAVYLGSWRGSQLALLAPIVLSLPVWAMIVAGNLDYVVLAGIVVFLRGVRASNPLLAGLGIVLGLAKPQLSVLAFLTLLPELRAWSWRMWAQLLIAPMITLVVSVAIAGLDWPVRLFVMLEGASGSLASWNVSGLHGVTLVIERIGLPGVVGFPLMALLVGAVLRVCWGESDLPRRVAVGMTLGAVAAPYLSSESLSVLMVGAWPRLLERGHYWLSMLVYLCQFLLVARAVGGYGAGVLVCIFSFVLLVALLTSERGFLDKGKWLGMLWSPGRSSVEKKGVV